MGLLRLLFGKADYRQPILDATIALANETERVYRNHLEDISPSSDGLLKLRLFSAAFGVMVYGAADCPSGEEDFLRFLYQCVDVAMRPFSQPCITKENRHDPHIAAAGNFLFEVFRLIQAEMTSGPSSVGNKTPAFESLAAVYHVNGGPKVRWVPVEK